MVTDEQLQQAKDFFGPSVDFTRVRFKTSPFCSGNRPWACGDVIRFKRAQPGIDLPVDTPDLIHECGHVWQHQNGQLVFLSAVGEQVRAALIKKFDPYNYGGALGVAHLQKLSSTYTESQAQIIAECWKCQHGFEQDRLCLRFTDDYTANLLRLVQGAHIGTAPPGTATLAGRIDSAVTQVVNWALGIFE